MENKNYCFLKFTRLFFFNISEKQDVLTRQVNQKLLERRTFSFLTSTLWIYKKGIAITEKNTITAVTSDMYWTACKSHPESLRNSLTTHLLSCRWSSCLSDGRYLQTVGITQQLNFLNKFSKTSYRFLLYCNECRRSR